MDDTALDDALHNQAVDDDYWKKQAVPNEGNGSGQLSTNYGSSGGGYNGVPNGGPGGFGPPPSFSSPPGGNGGGSGPPFPPNYYDSYKRN